MSDFFDIPTLVAVGVAIFVLLRLRSVLGTRTGHEKTQNERQAEKRKSTPSSAKRAKPSHDDVVVPLHPDLEQEEAERSARKIEAELDRLVGNNKELRGGLLDISNADDSFTPKSFLDGAGSAYEMIVTAFAAGDKSTLKGLLQKDVFEGFESAIDAREKAKQHVEFTFVGLPGIKYVQADMEKRNAVITICFDAEVVSATKDAEDNLIEGHEEQVVNLADEWTFSRSTKSRDPNWKLVATDQIS